MRRFIPALPVAVALTGALAVPATAAAAADPRPITSPTSRPPRM